MARKTVKKETRKQPMMDWVKIDRMIWNFVSSWDGSDEKRDSIIMAVKDEFMWSYAQAEQACLMHFNFWRKRNGVPEIPYGYHIEMERKLREEYEARKAAEVVAAAKKTRKKRTTKPKTEAKVETKPKTTRSKKTPAKTTTSKSKTTTKKTTTKRKTTKKKVEATLDSFM